MGSSYATILFVATLIARSVLAAPSQAQVPRVGTDTPSASITPEVVEHGFMDHDAFDALVFNATGEKVNSRIEPRATGIVGKKDAFLTYLGGYFLPGVSPTCPEFVVEGPIVGIDVTKGVITINTLKLKGLGGNSTTIAGPVSCGFFSPLSHVHSEQDIGRYCEH